MLAGIDHLVILVPDLGRAVADYGRQGFTVVPGGRHPTGTHNALIGLADGSYLELLAFYEPRPDSKWWLKLAQGGGLIAVCLQTDNLREEIATMREAGVAMGDPLPLSRTRPDGYALKWVMSFCEGERADLLPFLIEDETPRCERVPKETRHLNGVTGIREVTYAVPDLDVICRYCAAAFRREGLSIERKDLQARGMRFAFGRHAIDFVSPRQPLGALHDWLSSHDPAPFAFTLIGEPSPLLQPDIAASSGSQCPGQESSSCGR